MGNDASQLRLEQTDELVKSTNFSAKEIKRLYKRFRKLDVNNTGGITIDEFKRVPELSMNPLMTRVVCMFDTGQNYRVDFKDFVSAMSAFSAKAPKDEKLRFAFRVYDIDSDGFISNEELFMVLKMMVRATLSDHQLQQIVDQTMHEVDKDLDGRLSFEEFSEALAGTDLESKMTIRF